MSIQALAMGADGSIVAGMSQGRVVRWANGEWELLRKKKGAIQDVWVSTSGAVWMVGATIERSAGQLTKQKLKLGDDGFMCVWGTSDVDVWVSGYGPEIAHWDGNAWQSHDTGLDNDEMSYIAGIAGTPNDVYAGGEKGIAWWDGRQWAPFERSASTCLNGAATLSDGRGAFVGQSTHPEIWLVSAGSAERIVLDDIDEDELQRVAAGPSDRLYFTTGGRLLSWADGDLREELRDDEYDCYGVASNGESVATATSEGVWILEDEWRLVGQPTP